jgi:hypothetical protein
MRLTGLAIAMAMSLTACSRDDSTKQVSAETPPSETHVASAAPSTEMPVMPASAMSSTSSDVVKVYKDARCGCCKEWVKHLEQNGFKVETMDMPDLSAVKQKYGVMPEIQACHTAVVGGYAIEGHVPADLIIRMLKEKPAIAGLAVPGMPSGSPGMEGAMKEQYDVLTFDRAGRTTVYARR